VQSRPGRSVCRATSTRSSNSNLSIAGRVAVLGHSWLGKGERGCGTVRFGCCAWRSLPACYWRGEGKPERRTRRGRVLRRREQRADPEGKSEHQMTRSKQGGPKLRTSRAATEGRPEPNPAAAPTDLSTQAPVERFLPEPEPGVLTPTLADRPERTTGYAPIHLAGGTGAVFREVRAEARPPTKRASFRGSCFCLRRSRWAGVYQQEHTKQACAAGRSYQGYSVRRSQRRRT
jgi:hypothetical protein